MQAALGLGRHWAVITGPAEYRVGFAFFFMFVIFISGHVVISPNVRAETKLGKRQTYRGRRPEETCSFGVSSGFQTFFQTFSTEFFQSFPNFLKKLALEISLEKNGSDPEARRVQSMVKGKLASYPHAAPRHLAEASCRAEASKARY